VFLYFPNTSLLSYPCQLPETAVLTARQRYWQAIATLFAMTTAHVAISDLNKAHEIATLQEITAAGVKLLCIAAMFLQHSTQHTESFDQIFADTEGNLLVNSAGLSYRHPGKNHRGRLRQTIHCNVKEFF
jgi:hypothetical protein